MRVILINKAIDVIKTVEKDKYYDFLAETVMLYKLTSKDFTYFT